MTVAELIAELQNCPPDATVVKRIEYRAGNTTHVKWVRIESVADYDNFQYDLPHTEQWRQGQVVELA